ncbi:hypothetical protein Poli38472_000076 [Pythium oligandrum]|uniref:NADH:flavin oxidoreductase/NADH oxidase N-terminal domain-containing protein n=1 Tax=Pythium oligandrum TaxID=41045 RepID=A0A8K1CBK4_PYTOL|nr:hypothetical protein Poli38472_000076 [Pythium oligandrum]|eukprot:TMW60034.1 hypothetical protein Poli38472_000076 [Pythium oligandrum]
MAVPSKLFTPLTLGGKKNALQLQHRIAMAPLTRLRADECGIPPECVADHYAQRTTPGGLLVAEATHISPTARGYFGAPGIYSQEQIDAWKFVTKAVHDKGGVIFLQIWHTGRLSHPLNQPNGELPVSSSANMPIDEYRTVSTSEGWTPLVRPRPLETNEIPSVCEYFRQAAVNAIEAGFDGVELHGANGFLFEQFLHDGINDRTDKYGGSVENRARFLFETIEAILTSVDSSKVAVRLSPYNITRGQRESDPATLYKYVFEKLSDYDLAYAHIIEPRGFHYESDLTPKGGATKYFRQFYRGVYMTASGFDRDSSIEVVEAGDADIVAIGRHFISNPDLVKRFELNAPLAPYDRETFYVPGEKGYTDYPSMEEEDPLDNAPTGGFKSSELDRKLD